MTKTAKELGINRSTLYDKLEKLKDDARAGSRWVEEWSTVVEKECKILGLYRLDKNLVAADFGGDITQEQKDAAVEAVIAQLFKKVENAPVIKKLPDPAEMTIDAEFSSTD